MIHTSILSNCALILAQFGQLYKTIFPATSAGVDLSNYFSLSPSSKSFIVLQEFNDSCGDLFKTLGLNTLLGSCGQAITSPSSSSPSPPTGIDNTPEPAAGPSGDYNTDYAQPPQPNMDYSQTDYASPPAEAPGTIIPVIAASPSPALESPPSPMPSPSPAPATNTAVLAGLPASCETYYQTILNQSTEDQIACGQALAVSFTFLYFYFPCPDSAIFLFLLYSLGFFFHLSSTFSTIIIHTSVLIN